MSDLVNVAEFISRTLISIVTYRVNWREAEAVVSLENLGTALNAQFDICVYDNSPARDEHLSGVKHLNVRYTANGGNVGVSGAYNDAAEYAVACNKKWLLLLDSDFTFDEDLLAAYCRAVRAHPGSPLFCPVLTSDNRQVSPCRKIFHKSFLLARTPPGELSCRNLLVLNNGMLIALPAFRKAGGFSTGIPLDFSDEYFITAFSRHFENITVVDKMCEHRLSSYVSTGKKTALERFPYYCAGSRGMSVLFIDGFWYYLWGFFRAVKLAGRYKCLTFFKIYFDYHITGNMPKR